MKILFSIFAFFSFNFLISQTDFPKDTVYKFFKPYDRPMTEFDKEDQKKREKAMMNKTFAPGKKYSLLIPTMSNLTVERIGDDNYIIKFTEKETKFAFWFYRKPAKVNPKFISADAILRQFETIQIKDGRGPILLNIELTGGYGKSNWSTNEDTQSFTVHAKMISVTEK